MEYLIAAVIGLLGLLFYTNTKRKSAEALNENLKTKEEMIEIDKFAAELMAALKIEEQKRKDADSKLKEQVDEKTSAQDLIDFFNNKPKS